jgi:hypothetical protein
MMPVKAPTGRPIARVTRTVAKIANTATPIALSTKPRRARSMEPSAAANVDARPRSAVAAASFRAVVSLSN